MLEPLAHPVARASCPHASARDPGPAPGPRGRHLLGSLLEVRRDRLGFVRRAVGEHGPVVSFQMGRRRLFLLADPAAAHQVLSAKAGAYVKGIGLTHAAPLFGEGLLTASDELWSEQRQRLQHTFGRRRLATAGRHAVRATEEMLTAWRQSAAIRRQQGIDIVPGLTRLALAVLGRSLFSWDLAPRAEAVAGDLLVVSRQAMRRMVALVEVPASVPTPGNLRARRAVARLDRLVDEMIATHRGGEAHDDLIGVLLEAESSLGLERIRAELRTLLMAGHETVASSLAWACHLLATHPEVASRMAEEVHAVCGWRAPGPEESGRLPLTAAVVDETLRLYPPVWMIPRRAVAGDVVCGYSIPAGSDLLISVWSIHRDPRLWGAAESFRPERFLAAGGEAVHPNAAYLPFGRGPRTCIGRLLGRLEMILVLARLAQVFELAPAPGPPPEPEPLLTLRPRDGVRLRLVERRGR